MKITPLDLQQQTFQRSLKGYSPDQVDSFLEMVRGEWENLLREVQELREEVRRKEGRIREYREKEKTLQETLMSAQRLADDMKETAKKESEIVMGQAELEADKIIHQAHGRLTQIIDEINELKRQRAEFEGKLRGIIDSHFRLLDLQGDARDSGNLEDVAILSTS